MKHFLSVADLTPDEFASVLDTARDMKNGRREKPLAGKVIALILEHPSLRTRVSFEVGIRQLGGECVYLSRSDIGMGVREPVADVARVLGRWVDGIVVRTASPENVDQLAQHSTVPVVNAMTDREHPCQAVGDLLTILEHKGELRGLRVAFVGDGNNVAASLALACASVGADFVIASPPAFQIPTAAWEEAKSRAAGMVSKVGWVELPQQAVRDADVVYTDVWVSMGQEAERAERLAAFGDYQVTSELMGYAKPDAVFLHDMPAHEGEEIEAGMLDDPRSIVFDQAENRLHAQKAILSHLFRAA